MIKLFFRNKLVEILNAFYDNPENIIPMCWIVIGLIATCIAKMWFHYSLSYSLTIGGCLFISFIGITLFGYFWYKFGKKIFSSIFFFIGYIFSILFKTPWEFIKKNIELAKNGIKVEKHWNIKK